MILAPQSTGNRRKVTWIQSPSSAIEEYKIEIVDLSQVGLTTMDLDLDHSSSDQIVEIIPSSPTESHAELLLEVPSGDSNNNETPRPRKRARLDHLSAEQKSQHRKMMNRISAQSARDRQRALMKQQEELLKTLTATVDQLKEENQNLRKSNELLAKENSSLKVLVEENKELKSSVKNLEKKLDEASVLMRKTTEDRARPLVPAVPSTVPLPKGLGLKLFLVLHLMNLCFRSILVLQKSSKPLKDFQKKSLVKTRSLMILNKLLPLIAKELNNLSRIHGNRKRVKPP